MPELPEVETVVRSVRRFIVGRTIEGARFTSKHVTPGDTGELARKLIGRKIEAVGRRGKFILIQLDQGVLTVHLGMTGKLLVKGPAPDHTYGTFELSHSTRGKSNESVLLYQDP